MTYEKTLKLRDLMPPHRQNKHIIFYNGFILSSVINKLRSSYEVFS